MKTYFLILLFMHGSVLIHVLKVIFNKTMDPIQPMTANNTKELKTSKMIIVS